ncbi:hypothetical protein HI914_02287 [Erysiphe necator]|nr:hypothetical protein HI914_02287 [Erysiphe necator]
MSPKRTEQSCQIPILSKMPEVLALGPLLMLIDTIDELIAMRDNESVYIIHSTYKWLIGDGMVYLGRSTWLA